MQSNRNSGEKKERVLSQFSEEKLSELYVTLRKYCQFLTQSSFDGEDLVQESLLKAWNHYQNLPEVSTALVSKMAYNYWIDTVRKRKKETFILDENFEKVTNETDLAEVRFHMVEKLLSSLTPKQAVVFTLKEAFLFQSSEIAEILHTNEASVKSILYRAKQRLRKEESSPIHFYWESAEEVEHLSFLLHETLREQDPTILIQAIPFLHSLQKETMNPTCSIFSSKRSLSSSRHVYMAA